MVSLGFRGRAYDVSQDGDVVAGVIWGAPHEAFRWTQDSGPVGLGHLSSADEGSLAYALSSDGSVVVGESGYFGHVEAFRWTQATGMQGLGDLPGGDFLSTAYAVSGDGSIVVGVSDVGYGGGLRAPFIWDQVHGMRDLQDVLEDDFGLDLGGWRLRRASGISADGQSIVGWGYNPAGYQEAWIATIPEPTTLLLLALGSLALLRKGR